MTVNGKVYLIVNRESGRVLLTAQTKAEVYQLADHLAYQGGIIVALDGDDVTRIVAMAMRPTLADMK
jgi:hypothetical protein